MSRITRRSLLGAVPALPLISAIPLAPADAQEALVRDFLVESRERRDERMKWWREARFGMFIHWGVYSVPAGVYKGKPIEGIGEWIQASAGIPRDEYARFPPQFNPVKFDAREWARIMKQAGMKYVVITSKHHDGFALFDSKVSYWDVVDATPYKRDILAQLSRACRQEGIRFCTYYSILDWHHPSQMPNPKAGNPHQALASNAMKPGRKDDYMAYLKAQLGELLDSCDPEVLWFDGEWVDWWTEADGKHLYNWLRTRKPSLIVNNRVGKGRKGMEGLSRDDSYAGDFGTPEQQIPPTGIPGVDWESCMTMNDTWGYKSTDHNWKSATTLIRNLCDTASKGGNFLLNVGPTSEGLIPAASVERLHAVGLWTQANGEAIYGTHASPFSAPLAWGRATQRGARVYLHVFDWPRDGKLAVPALPGREVRSARLLSGTKAGKVSVARQGMGVTLSLPSAAPDAAATVVVLETRSTK